MYNSDRQEEERSVIVARSLHTLILAMTITAFATALLVTVWWFIRHMEKNRKFD